MLAAAVTCAALGLPVLPQGVGGLVAAARAQGANDERQAYEKAMADPTIANLRDYLRRFPLGEGRPAISTLLLKRQDEVAWEAARRGGNQAALSLYLDLYPSGIHADEARRMMSALPPSQPPAPPGNSPQPPPAVEPATTETPPPQPAAPSFNRFVNRDLTGNADGTIPAGTIEDCESFCASNNSCVGYTYSRWARLCFLKSYVGELSMNARVTSGVKGTYGTPPASGSAVTFERFRQRGFLTSGTRQTSATSVAGCENACWNWDACIAYTFRSARGLCDLYDVTNEYYSQAGSMSGAKRQD
jgi:hypothetical protein